MPAQRSTHRSAVKTLIGLLLATGALSACDGPLDQARESAQAPQAEMPFVAPGLDPVPPLPEVRDPRDPSPAPIGPSPDPNPGGDYGFPRDLECDDSTAC
jgi:hypothetical protein